MAIFNSTEFVFQKHLTRCNKNCLNMGGFQHFSKIGNIYIFRPMELDIALSDVIEIFFLKKKILVFLITSVCS